MKFKAVIFDLDGTLLDTIADIARAMNAVCRKHGFPESDEEEYKSRVGWGRDVMVRKSIPDWAEKDGLVEEMGKEWFEVYAADPVGLSKPYPGIITVLDYLEKENIPMSVLSNKTDLLTKDIVERIFRSSRFAAVRGAMDELPKKPDPSAALELAGIMDCAKEDIVFFGDTAVDMETARNAGMYPVGVSWGFREPGELEKTGASKILDKAEEILDFL